MSSFLFDLKITELCGTSTTSLAVSISLSLAQRSLISRSISAFPVGLPLLRTSLSSRSGDCLSLLGGMVSSSLCYPTKENSNSHSDTTLTQPYPSVGGRSTRTFSFSEARRVDALPTPLGSFRHPQDTSWRSPLSVLGDRVSRYRETCNTILV
jgi:hypothetical protein